MLAFLGVDHRLDVDQVNVHPNGEWSGGIEMTLTYKDCRAKDDLGAVICPRLNIDPSCTLFTPWGTRVTSCSDIKSFDSIFLVPPQKLAILPIREIRTEIQHIGLPIERENSLPKPIHMLTLSDRPRIVQFDNVATSSEIEMLHSYFENELPFYVGANARDERSVDEIDAVEVQGDVGLGLRKRLFDLLGIFPFNDALAEPLTIMRLNASQSLALTRDYLYADGRRADLDVDHNYTASNRFLTVLLVLSKVSHLSCYL